MRALRIIRSFRAWSILAAICMTLTGCSSSQLVRTDWIATDQATEIETCKQKAYKPLDDMAKDAYTKEGAAKMQMLSNVSKRIQEQLGTPDLGRCWLSAWEQHKDFELFVAEFDDVGMATDQRECVLHDGTLSPTSPCIQNSQLARLYKRLEEFDCGATDASAKPCKLKQPVNIVVFTHGWHGSASPYHWYTIGFRNMLNSIAVLEEQRAAHESAETGETKQARKVIGIEIAWRGDSIITPQVLSVWDRKQAAETLALGAVQGLLAHMHDFYQRNTCHIDNRGLMPGDLTRCGHANMLMLGHSYGALIDFRSLVGQLASGLRIDYPQQFAYSFGDLVILVNPAFEGIRFTPTFLEAQRRVAYPMPGVAGNDIGQSQLPVLVTLQSEGDIATKFWFKAFRQATTAFDNPQTAEESNANTRAVGWVDEYVTHRLILSEKKDNYDDEKYRGESAYSCRARAWSQTGFTALVGNNVLLGSGLMLNRDLGNRYSNGHATDNDASPTAASRDIPGFPLWSVRVDKAVMADHDDIWNKYTNYIMLQLYWTVILQNEKVTTDLKRKKNGELPEPLDQCE